MLSDVLKAVQVAHGDYGDYPLRCPWCKQELESRVLIMVEQDMHVCSHCGPVSSEAVRLDQEQRARRDLGGTDG